MSSHESKDRAGRPNQLEAATLRRYGHVCALFQDKEEEYRILLPFISEGFRTGDRAFHVVDPKLRALHLERLRQAGIDVDLAQQTGQLEVWGWEDAYFSDGRFDQDRMLAFIQKVLDEGRARGFPQTRFIADMGWAKEDRPGVEVLVEYEVRLNQLLMKYGDPVLCVYDPAKFGGRTVVDIIRTHPLSIAENVVQENPFFTPPEEFLRELRERKARANQAPTPATPEQPRTAESLPADELRRCIRDLLGILALNGTWRGSDFKSIVDTLLEMMTGLVQLEFVLAKVAARPDGPAEYFFKAPTSAFTAEQHQLVPILEEYLKGQRMGAIMSPLGQGTLRVVSVPIGVNAKWGTAVAGSSAAAFPTLIQLLLLSVAANQAAIALEDAYLHSVEMDNLRLEAEKLEAEADLARVRRQLEPHFLLNTLNAVAGLLTVAPGEARQLLESLGELLRDSLREGDEFQPLGKRIDWLRRYASILETRHAGRIVFHWQIADETRDLIIRRFLLQPLLENAVQHGALMRPRGGEVTVRTELVNASNPRAAKLVCVIEDNGPGLSPTEPRSGGVGLTLVRRLLALTYGERASLRLESSTTGTRATVEIPAERAQRRRP